MPETATINFAEYGLSNRDVECMAMYLVDGLTAREIAEIFGTSRQCEHSRIQRCLSRLKSGGVNMRLASRPPWQKGHRVGGDVSEMPL